jgi:hypothetical protein
MGTVDSYLWFVRVIQKMTTTTGIGNKQAYSVEIGIWIGKLRP